MSWWPWSRTESQRLRDKARSYEDLSAELADDARDLQTMQDNIANFKDDSVTRQRSDIDALESALSDRYLDTVTRNNVQWNSLLDHCQEGIDMVSKGSLDAADLAVHYHALADAAALEEANQD